MEISIKLDVPEWQDGQPVTVYFKDTMRKEGVSKEFIRCENCRYWHRSTTRRNSGECGIYKYIHPLR